MIGFKDQSKVLLKFQRQGGKRCPKKTAGTATATVTVKRKLPVATDIATKNFPYWSGRTTEALEW